MKKNTRKHDLEELEEARDFAKEKERRLHRAALLEAVYEMSKDEHLEKLRIQLVDALKRGDLTKMAEIRRKVQDYVKTQSFKRNIASKISKVAGEKEAKNWCEKLSK